MALTPSSSRAGSGGLFDAYAYLRDEKAANTEGGGFTSGAWQTRTLNTEVADPDEIVSLAANQFTLQAGNYWIEARAPAFAVGVHKLKLRNITDATDDAIGDNVRNDATDNQGGIAHLAGRITPTAAKVYELQHRCGTTKATNGFGALTNFAVIEVYAEVFIWREA